ncbi:hypothetical protein [Muricoccus aerilatus]|uniref:hypothetical protein n=1 Tax=Muricoccus aerilatus TaxID=452982 RepID=UPI0005C19C93|nr:hypothetical protein [Roseomonas aerilata]
MSTRPQRLLLVLALGLLAAPVPPAAAQEGPPATTQENLPAAAVEQPPAATPLHPVAPPAAAAPPSFRPSPPGPRPGAAMACDPPPDALLAAACADPTARQADRRRAQAYDTLLDQLPPAQRPALEADARAFAEFLAANCAQPAPDLACFTRAQEAKREDLRRWLLPEAREEADRDPAETAAVARALAARGIPAEPPSRRREAIVALQRGAGLSPSGFIDDRTAILLTRSPAPPAPAPAAPPARSNPAGLPPEAFWVSALPPLLSENYAVTTCSEPTVTWLGRGMLIGNQPVPGEAGYEIYGTESTNGDRIYLLPRGGQPRVIEVLQDGSLRLSGAIPPALSERGVAPNTTLARCPATPVATAPAAIAPAVPRASPPPRHAAPARNAPRTARTPARRKPATPARGRNNR